MRSGLIGTFLAFGLCLVLIGGLRARRTRLVAAFGLVPASGACLAFSVVAIEPQVDAVLRYAYGLVAIALGCAHAVVFSIAALPRERVWLRSALVFAGLWGGALTALWIFSPERHLVLDVLVGILATIAVLGWVSLPFLSREKGFTRLGELQVPSVRFACPRCGTRVDWGKGVAACTDCGLFLHIAWPAREDAEPARAPAPAPPRSVRFSCPSCGARGTFTSGVSACRACGLAIALHWNVHTRDR